MKPLPRAVERLRAKRRQDRDALGLRRQIRERDRYCCRACGARATPDNPVDVHHRQLRSAGGDDSTANCLLLCRACHALCHAWRLFIHGTDANRRLRFERVGER